MGRSWTCCRAALSPGQLLGLLSLLVGQISSRCFFLTHPGDGECGEEGAGSSPQQVMNGPIIQTRVSPARAEGFVTAAIVYVPRG